MKSNKTLCKVNKKLCKTDKVKSNKVINSCVFKANFLGTISVV